MCVLVSETEREREIKRNSERERDFVYLEKIQAGGGRDYGYIFVSLVSGGLNLKGTPLWDFLLFSS